MAVTIALATFFTLVSLALFLLMRREVRLAKADLLESFRQLFRDAHPKGYPSAAAVVTEGTPAAGEAPKEEEPPQLPPPAPVPVPAQRAGIAELPANGSQLRRITPAELRLARQAWAEGRAPIEIPGPIKIAVKPDEMSERIAQLYGDLVSASEAAGQPASHCGGDFCFEAHADVAICTCDCEACRRAVEFLVRAQDEAVAPGKSS